MATNPYQAYQAALSGQQYPGSSGYYFDEDSLTSSPYGISRTGSGYAGDRAKNAIASRYGLTPSAAGTNTESWGTSDSLSEPTIGADGLAYQGGSTSLFTGKSKRTGKVYQNGVELSRVPGSTDYINANDPTQRYSSVSIDKNPAISKEADTLTADFTKAAESSIKDYNSILSDYQKQAGTAEDASKAAADVSGTTGALTDAQKQYAGELGGAQTDYAALDAANAAKQRAIVAARYGDEATYNALMDQANQLAQAGVTKSVSRFGSAKNAAAGANLGMGTDTAALAARESYTASLPYQMAKEKYHQENLANEAGVETQLTADEARRIGFDVSTNTQKYQSAQGTAQAIQALKVSAAALDWETVNKIMQVPQLAAQVQQQILSGDTQLAQALNALKSQSTYQGLYDKLGVNVSQPNYYSLQNPSYPNARTPQTQTPQYFQGGTSGATSTGTTDAQGNQLSPTQQWQNYWNAKGAPSNVAGARGQFAGNYLDAQGNSYYDAATGTLRDRTTGEITGYPNSDMSGGDYAYSNPITGADEG